jgi:hypothetical protein
MRPLSRTVAALAAPLVATLVATSVAAPALAVPITTLNPAKLSRGADVTIPHLEKKTVVDGSVRVRVKAPTVRLLGKAGSAYVVGTANKTGGHGRILRVNADGTSSRLVKANIYQTELSGDGQSIVSTRVPSNARTVVTVWSATTGAQVASRKFHGYVSTLDADTGRVLVGSLRKTVLWTTSTGSVAVVSRDGGYAGDLSADVFAAYTKDPYNGGCTVVSKISTGEQLWKSCKERVETFNADGSRMATIDILSDGIGPAWAAARAITGKKLGVYQVRNGWFGAIDFETTTALLLQTNGFRKAATVRCTDTTCERASDLTGTVQPKTS